ncbi:allatostatin-A receptor [Lingula anatina]|uniref:Allatostatin-A receptor n=1 Tax=Lingula anatina TaxID=7574 RepID=A0A1S3JF34_LINAN|nr:allatostatin-A receptor [Lingula anatina]|eukprot:XP_013409025.1 allatostatin-A receptor [Lingula anatina]
MALIGNYQRQMSRQADALLENGTTSGTYDTANGSFPLQDIYGLTAHMTNGSSNSSSFDNSELLRFLQLLELFSLLCPIFFGVVFLIGVCGNGLVIYVITSNNCLRTCPNMLFLNLAVADLLFLLFCVPLQGAFYIDYSLVLGEYVCKLFKYTVFVTMSVSAYTLVAICIFRCIAIASPLQSSITLTKRHSGLASLLTWIVMIAVNTPVAIFYTEERDNHCQFVYYLKIQMYIFNTITIGIDFLLPMAVFCVGTMFIIHALRKRNQTMYKMNALHRGSIEDEQSRRNTRKLVVLVITVAVVFFLSWLPFHVIALINIVKTTPYVFSTVAQLLAFANSCFNPIIYNFASAGFRRAFINALQCCPVFRLQRSLTTETRNTQADIPLNDVHLRRQTTSE